MLVWLLNNFWGIYLGAIIISAIIVLTLDAYLSYRYNSTDEE